MIILGKESSRKIQAREKAPKVGKKTQKTKNQKKAENKFSAVSIVLILTSHPIHPPVQHCIDARLEKKLKIVTKINAPIVEVVAISVFSSD